MAEEQQPSSTGRAIDSSVEVELEQDMPLGDATADLEYAEMQEQINRELRKAELKARMKQERDGKGGPAPAGEGGEANAKAPPVEVPPEVCKTIFDSGSYMLSCPRFKLEDSQAEAMANSLTAIFKELNISGSGILWHGIIVIMITLSKVVACKDKIAPMFKKEEQPQQPQQPDYEVMTPNRPVNQKKITFADNIPAAVNKAKEDEARMAWSKNRVDGGTNAAEKEPERPDGL